MSKPIILPIDVAECMCILSCLFQLLFRFNLLSHCEQLYGFSLVCILSCLLQLLFRFNLFSHCEQLYGFSLVCILSWLLHSFFCSKPFVTNICLALFEQQNSVQVVSLNSAVFHKFSLQSSRYAGHIYGEKWDWQIRQGHNLTLCMYNSSYAHLWREWLFA